jgi:hypothetical protein
MYEIDINPEGPCAKAVYCMIASQRYLKNSQWPNKKELYVADGRAFAKVKIATPRLIETQKELKKWIDPKKVYFMDAITGTLYFEDGICVSNYKKQRKFVRDQKLATKILNETRAI